VKKRTRIPHSIEAEILFRNDRTCCICRNSAKRVQIHHIDGNPSNNVLENLAIVCPQHQDELHKSGGITKGIPPLLVKKYKRSWELTVRKRRSQKSSPLSSESGVEKTLFEFEIRKIAYELVSLADGDTAGIEQRLEYLHAIHLHEGYSDRILKVLSSIAIFLALAGKNKPSLVADKIYEFFYHLPGPEEVPIRKNDIKNLKSAIDIVGTIGSFSGQFNKSVKVISNVCRSFENFLYLFIWYDLEDLALAMLKQFEEVRKGYETSYEDERPLSSGVNKLDKLLQLVRDTVKKQRPGWKKALERLR
jgi:hypothetical protein